MDSFYMTYVVASDLRELLGRSLIICVLNYSKQLFDATTCEKRTAEKAVDN